jgi:hypothetical protein
MSTDSVAHAQLPVQVVEHLQVEIQISKTNIVCIHPQSLKRESVNVCRLCCSCSTSCTSSWTLASRDSDLENQHCLHTSPESQTRVCECLQTLLLMLNYLYKQLNTCKSRFRSRKPTLSVNMSRVSNKNPAVVFDGFSCDLVVGWCVFRLDCVKFGKKKPPVKAYI